VSEQQGFVCEPDPDNPGWLSWRLADASRYNEAVLGPFWVRAEGPTTARVRIEPQHRHTNNAGNIHGAVTLGFIDIALFAALQNVRGVPAAKSVTLGIDTQFIGSGDASRPLDAVVEVLRETRRLAFLRGLVVQDEDVVAAFSATIRKPTDRA
jgi:acyl-coenzyme A thioesterase PaaI-like protein